MSYAKRLELALIEADLKAAELSRRTGISKACLSQYLSGVSIPREDRQELIADALSKDLDWFFPEKDEPIPGADEGRDINLVYNKNYQMTRSADRFIRIVKEVYDIE